VNAYQKGEKLSNPYYKLHLRSSAIGAVITLTGATLNLFFLPPYSPDFNPIEQLWKIAKDNFFNGWYAKNIEQLDDRVCEALLALINNPEQVKKTASMLYLIKKLS
jgi:transposase